MLALYSSGPHHQDSGEAKIRESTAGVSRKPSSDGKACGCSSKHLCGLTAELVSEVSAPLSAAKLCDDRRNNT